MEALIDRRALWLLFALVLLIRVPFWNHAIQGDDTIYLTEAEHALIEPLHPDHTGYVFRGETVDLRGHPHGPVNAWVLAAVLAFTRDVKEIPLHAVFTVFSLIAVWAMWSLARRFSPRPLWAALLFIAVPVFVVNGNSLETDIPFLAIWMAAIALFTSGRIMLACVPIALAGMTSPQAVFLTPILGLWSWLHRPARRIEWLAVFTAPAALLAWNVFERLSTGAMPARVLGGYLTRFDVFNPRARIALLIHTCFLIFPALVPAALAVGWRKRREPDTLFLLAWMGIFFAGLCTAFFAGSARYVLPLAAPLALLASRLRVRWLAPAFAVQLALGLGLAAMNYQHWAAYRVIATDVPAPTAHQRVWVDDEWGLRHYMEARGAVPLTKTQQLRPGDLIVSSELSHAVEINAPVTTVRTVGIRSPIPLRIIGLETNSGYSTISKGLWPFGVSNGIIDRVHVWKVGERHVELEYVTVSSGGRDQIVSGMWPDGWTSGTAVLLLKSPAAPEPVSATVFVPPNATARRVVLSLDGREVASENLAGPGSYKVATAGPVELHRSTATLEIQLDRTFTAPPDIRELGVVLIGAGFEK